MFTLLAHCTRVFVVVQTIPQAVLSWVVVVICNSAMLFFSISIGRTLLSAIPELLVDQTESNGNYCSQMISGLPLQKEVYFYLVWAYLCNFFCQICLLLALVLASYHLLLPPVEMHLSA